MHKPEIESRKLSRNIDRLMHKNGLTQMELAKRAGVSQGSISLYIQGGKIPKHPSVLRIAQALNVSLEELLK